MSDNLIGATTAIFIVSLSIAVNEPVDVAWSTRDGTAKAGTDYQAANGVVTFLPGETEKQIEVIVYGQNVSPTGDKNFFINLTPPTNAVLGTALIEAVIKVEDEAGVPVTTVIVAQGRRGLKGDPGLSAYDQAVLMGYDGTVEDWMQEQADAAAAAQRAGDYAADAASAATKAENAATAASFLGNIFPTPEAGVDPVTGVGNGAYYNVRSTEDDSFLVEYQNIGGVPTPSGKKYPSAAAVNALAVDVKDVKESIIDPDTGNPTTKKVLDPSGLYQHQLNTLFSATIENIDDLDQISPLFFRTVFVKSHHDGNGLGKGFLTWDASVSKASHDGGCVIDPLMIQSFPTDWTSTSQVSTWLTGVNSGNGCWVRDKQITPTIFDYGFTPDSIAHNATNTIIFQKSLDKNIVVRVPMIDAPLYVTKGINVKNGRRIVGDSDYMNEPLIADPDRGIIGDGTGAVFTTGTYPATANTNRQLHFKSLRVRNTTFPCFDLLHSDDAVLDDCIGYTTGGTVVRQFFSARVRYLGGHYASSFASYSDDNFAIRIYDNCNGTWISPTTVIAGGANGGAVDVTKCQKVSIDGVIETNGGYGVRVAGYNGGDLPLWQPSTAYVRGERVKNTTNAWVCKVDHTSSASFSTDQATKWEVTNGNCNGVAVNGYYEATNKPVSIGTSNLVLGAKLGTSSLYVGGANSSNPQFSIELGAVSGLDLCGGVSLHKKGTEPTFKFVQPSSGSSITDYLTNSTLKDFHVQGGGPDFQNNLTIPDQIGLLFGRNEIKLNAASITSGQVREYVSPLIAANVGLAASAFILSTGNGGVIDAIEVIDAAGTLGCTIRVGRSDSDGENLVLDPSTVTLSNGAASATLASTLIRPSKQQVLRVVAGSGTGTFRVRVRYRM